MVTVGQFEIDSRNAHVHQLPFAAIRLRFAEVFQIFDLDV